jgi:hypothetical protein
MDPMIHDYIVLGLVDSPPRRLSPRWDRRIVDGDRHRQRPDRLRVGTIALITSRATEEKIRPASRSPTPTSC